jgi:hypothetical protein
MFKRRRRKTATPRRTFIDDLLSGRALVSDIDDYIDRWHDSPEGSPEAAMQLHEFLGMSWDEYRLWAEQPASLRFALAARRAKRPLPDVLRQLTLVGAALVLRS